MLPQDLLKQVFDEYTNGTCRRRRRFAIARHRGTDLWLAWSRDQESLYGIANLTLCATESEAQNYSSHLGQLYVAPRHDETRCQEGDNSPVSHMTIGYTFKGQVGPITLAAIDAFGSLVSLAAELSRSNQLQTPWRCDLNPEHHGLAASRHLVAV